ncbi:MAG: cupin domain-containing protein [Chloroflexi bacterium]|nr:cupin domain-containing protein [Chloroflexota bacterium]
MISFVHLSPDAVIPTHRHPHEQMGMGLEGEFEMIIGDVKRTVKKGDAYLVPSNVEHSVRNYGGPSLALDIFSPPREDYMS